MKLINSLLFFSMCFTFSIEGFAESESKDFQKVEVLSVPGSAYNGGNIFEAISHQFKTKVVELCGDIGKAQIKEFSYSVNTPDSLVPATTLDLDPEGEDLVYFHGYQFYKLSAMVKCPDEDNDDS